MSQSIYDKRYYERHKEKIAERRRAYRMANKDKRRIWNQNYRFKKFYGIDRTMYEQMVKDQGNACAICKEIKPLCVDHSHTSGKCRGLLCHKCNKAIGLLNDNPYIMQSAREYLVINM